MAGKPNLTPDQQKAFNKSLRSGIDRKDSDMIKLALDNGAEPNILLFAGIDFKPTLKDTFTYADPKAWALEWVQQAVEYGADVNARRDNNNKKPYAALHWCYENFNPNVASFLIEKGADVDTPTPFNNTPLLRAVSDGKIEIAQFFLSKGADPLKPCGEKLDNFPLKELQSTDKIKAARKPALEMLMMEHTKPRAPATTAPEPDPSLSESIEISKPIQLKQPPARSFSL